MLIFVLAIILVALTFEYINGFHDTANAIATSVATKVLTPFQAVAIAATFDLVGALVGTAVAKTIAAGLVDTAYVSLITILCALLSAIVWNLLTWWLGLPSSSSHALIGGLCGAAVASAHGVWSVIRWSVFNPATNKMEGLLPKVILPMFISPINFFSLVASSTTMSPSSSPRYTLPLITIGEHQLRQACRGSNRACRCSRPGSVENR